MNAGAVSSNAIRVNRPHEVFGVMPHIRRPLSPAGLTARWNYIARADHMISDYKAELVTATDGRRHVGIDGQASLFERQVRALAALGDTSRLRQKADSFITAWNRAWGARNSSNFLYIAHPLQLYLIAALELSAHGRRREALASAKAGLSWHAPRPANGDSASIISERWLAQLLALSGQLDSARVIWSKFAATDSVYNDARIELAIIAAQQGDTLAALQTMHVLDSLASRPYAYGRPWVNSARIAAALGRKDDAVDFLQRAMNAHAPFDPQWHQLAEFQLLRDFVPFKELLAPKG